MNASVTLSPSRIFLHPYRAAQKLPAAVRVRPAALLVLASGLLMAITMLLSYLDHSYPAPPEVLKVYIDAWGEFPMLPFLKMPAESYRLFLAVIFVPLVFAIWMLMAGTAKLLSLLFGGKASYEQYLVITAFGFFPFWILAGVIDGIFSGVIDGYVLQALTGQLGPFATSFWTEFPKAFYIILYGLGGVWIAISTAGVESFKWWKVMPIALLTFTWPMILMSALVR